MNLLEELYNECKNYNAFYENTMLDVNWFTDDNVWNLPTSTTDRIDHLVKDIPVEEDLRPYLCYSFIKDKKEETFIGIAEQLKNPVPFLTYWLSLIDDDKAYKVYVLVWLADLEPDESKKIALYDQAIEIEGTGEFITRYQDTAKFKRMVIKDLNGSEPRIPTNIGEAIQILRDRHYLEWYDKYNSFELKEEEGEIVFKIYTENDTLKMPESYVWEFYGFNIKVSFQKILFTRLF